MVDSNHDLTRRPIAKATNRFTNSEEINSGLQINSLLLVDIQIKQILPSFAQGDTGSDIDTRREHESRERKLLQFPPLNPAFAQSFSCFLRNERTILLLLD